MRKIAYTFGGRRAMMSNQARFVRDYVAQGIFDEWHVWDFTRNEADREWLAHEFGGSLVLFTMPDSVAYRPLVSAPLDTLALNFVANNDAHVLLEMGSGACVEIVLGAFSNTRSLLRIFPEGGHRPDAEPALTSASTLREGAVNSLDSRITETGHLRLFLNGEPLFTVDLGAERPQRLSVHTGHGAIGEWWLAGTARGGARLMITGLKSYEGFRFVYNHYANARYADTCFTKLDDDIVYCDGAAIRAFVDHVAASPGLDLYSANVVNNGVCAYHQGQRGLFGADATFEYPSAGTCGSLWESAALCTLVHRSFIDARALWRRVMQAGPVLLDLPLRDRFSINFIAFKQALMPLMSAAYATTGSKDDEQIMTQFLPVLYGVGKRVYLPLLVAHLSFFKQDETLDSAPLLQAYAAIADECLATAEPR